MKRKAVDGAISELKGCARRRLTTSIITKSGDITFEDLEARMQVKWDKKRKALEAFPSDHGQAHPPQDFSEFVAG